MSRPTFFVLLLLTVAAEAAPAQDSQPAKKDPAASQPTTKPTSQPRRRRPPPDWEGTAAEALFSDVTAQTIGTTAEWTNKVELADIDGDGRVDLLFANGGDYDRPGKAVPSRIFLNRGPGKMFEEATRQVFGDQTFFARVIKVRDVNADGLADIVVGTTFETQSRLFLGRGSGKFEDVTATHLPQLPRNVGDIEFADVDADGDLDMALAEWGQGSPMKNEGGRTMLWKNDGRGKFEDVTSGAMPDVLVKFSWEIEFVDYDGDFDLDLLVSAKMSPGSFLFENDGRGTFKNATEGKLPQFSNNYEFEAMDVDGDGLLDLVTINDGRFTEHVFTGQKAAGYCDATADLWPKEANPSFDDNMIAFFDYDSDGDADFLIGSLDGPDRLLVNDGKGGLTMKMKIFTGAATPATLAIGIADLDGDGKMDCVHAQGEVPNQEAEKVFFGSNIARDSAAPVIGDMSAAKDGSALVVRARVHDRKSGSMPHDWRSITVDIDDDGKKSSIPMTWYGEYLFTAKIPAPGPKARFRITAIDACGNSSASVWRDAK